MSIAKRVETIWDAPSGSFKVSKSKEPHPADGLTITVSLGDGAYEAIINPQSFTNGGPEWVMRYGDPASIRFAVASLLSSYDYLLSSNINMKEATDRLRILRAVRRAALAKEGE